MAKCFFWAMAAALALPACGGKVIVDGGSGGAGAVSPCPDVEPFGNPCDGVPDGFRCTYGDSPRPDCRREWTCSNGNWTTTKSVCLSPPADHCAFTEPPSGVCGQEGDVCVIGQSICDCTSCAGGPCMVPPPTWQCAGPPATAGCPAIVPNDGGSCGAEGVTCTYGLVCTSSGAQVKCVGGLWIWNQQLTCPA